MVYYYCCCCCRPLLLPLFSVVIAILLGLYFNTLRLTPHVSIAQIELDGGHALVLHDDRVIEYYTCGDPKGVPLIFFHGSATTGMLGLLLCDLAYDYGHRVVSVSLPGWGATSPIPGRGYFEGARDTLAVLDHLGYGSPHGSPLHIMGISYGAGTAAALAQLIPQAKVRSLLLVVPGWPSMGDYDIMSSASVLSNIVSYRFVDRIYSYYITRLNIDLHDALKVTAPEELAEIEREKPDLIESLDRDYKRSVKYHHEGVCEVGRIIQYEGKAINEKRELLNQLGERLSIWYGLKDQMVPPSGSPTFLARIFPRARVFAFERGHLTMLIDLRKYFEEMKRNDH